MKQLGAFFLFTLAFYLPLNTVALAETSSASQAQVEEVVRQIEKRQGTWVGFQTDLKIYFQSGDKRKASCQGHLAYDRLEEKLLLQCYNDKKNLLFAFKTEDKNFDLYLPGQKSVYSGSIFDLQDSPDIESHLRALDLYRALKTMALPIAKTRIENKDKKTITLTADSMHYKSAYIARKVQASSKGDVFKDIFYGPDGKPETEISRSQFKEVKNGDKKNFFPNQVDIRSCKAGTEKCQETSLVFKKSKFVPEIKESELKLPVDADAKKFVSEGGHGIQQEEMPESF